MVEFVRDDMSTKVEVVSTFVSAYGVTSGADGEWRGGLPAAFFVNEVDVSGASLECEVEWVEAAFDIAGGASEFGFTLAFA